MDSICRFLGTSTFLNRQPILNKTPEITHKWANQHRQCQRKAHKKSLKESDKNPEITHNITETCKEYNKTTTEYPYQTDKKLGTDE